MEKYTMESVIRGHHVYKSILHPILGEQLVLERVEGNGHDRHAVSVMKVDSDIVGHIPRELSRAYWYFIRHGGAISCEVTGSRASAISIASLNFITSIIACTD